jgi:hypothetical protein
MRSEQLRCTWWEKQVNMVDFPFGGLIFINQISNKQYGVIIAGN